MTIERRINTWAVLMVLVVVFMLSGVAVAYPFDHLGQNVAGSALVWLALGCAVTARRLEPK